MFGISGTELVLIAVFAFIVFGPDKIPQIAKTVGKAVQMFKSAQDDMERLIKAEMYDADPEKHASLLGTAEPKAEPGEETAPGPTVASTLYAPAQGDDEEEDEE